MSEFNSSNISLKITLPDGTKREVEPYEVPEVNAMLTQAVANLKERNLKLTEALEQISKSDDSGYMRGIALDILGQI